MIQPISNNTFQSVKYFSILKLLILQQNISSIWIFGDRNSWNEHGIETNEIVQHLVGTLPKYVFDLNNGTRPACVDNENIKNLIIFLVSQRFGPKELKHICPTDYAMVLIQNTTTKIVLPQKYSNNTLKRLVFGTLNASTIANMELDDDFDSVYANNRSMEDLFTKISSNMNLSEFRIFFQIGPPNSMLAHIDKKYIFYGPDAQVAKEISKMLNATAVYQTNIGIEYPRYEYWFNDTKYTNNAKLLKIRNRILTTNFISDFYQK